MNKIQVANILLTQRCNLNCSYCHLVKNYSGMPKEYPRMEYYAKNEISYIEWLSIFYKLKKNNDDVFFIIYGGCPMLYKDIMKLIVEMERQNMNYTIISNNTDFVQPVIFDILSKIGKFRGFSSSIDPIIVQENVDCGTDRMRKSLDGFARLVRMKKEGWADDVVAEITCDATNIHNLYPLIKMLTEKGICSDITAIDCKKSEYYDFASPTPDYMILTKELAKDAFEKIKNDTSLLVHIPKMLDGIYNQLPCDYMCRLDKDITNVSISPDGRFRLCLRIRGVNTSSYHNSDLITNDGKVTEKFNNCMEADHKAYCKGCNWTCILSTEIATGQDIINHI